MSHVIDDKCSCGEPIKVEIDCERRVCRKDGKRPFYADDKLPDGLDPELYDINNSTVFRCRKCSMPVDETVKSAAFED